MTTLNYNLRLTILSRIVTKPALNAQMKCIVIYRRSKGMAKKLEGKNLFN